MTGDRTIFLFIAGFLAYRCCDFIGLRHKLRQTIIREARRAASAEYDYAPSLLGGFCSWIDGAAVMIGMFSLLLFFSVFGFAELMWSKPTPTQEQQILSIVTVCASLGISLVGALVEALRLEQEQV